MTYRHIFLQTSKKVKYDYTSLFMTLYHFRSSNILYFIDFAV